MGLESLIIENLEGFIFKLILQLNERRVCAFTLASLGIENLA